MDKLIEFFETILLYVLYPKAEERAKQYELRKIWRELRYLKLAYTDIQGKRVFSSYASKLYALNKLVITLRKILQLPARRQELLQETDLIEYLVLHQLEPQTRRQLNSFSYDVLMDRIKHASDQTAGWKTVEREWTEFSRQISELQSRKLSEDLFQLELLYALMEFDFDSLFKIFDPSFVKDQPQQVPRFSDVSSTLVDQYLRDFYFIIANFKVTPNTRTILSDVCVYYHEENAEQISALRESIDYIELLFENELSENTLRALLQLIHQDPELYPDSAGCSHDYIEEVHSRLSKRFANNRERVKRDLTEATTRSTVEELLAGHPLEDMYGYSREDEEPFHQLGLSGFLYTLPLQAVKSYYKAVFTKGILGSLRRVHEDGFYEDSDFQRDFGESIRQFADVINRIDVFESQLQKHNGLSVEQVLEMARLNGSSIQNFIVIEKFVEDVNRAAEKLLQHAGKAAENLHRKLGAVIGDHRSTKPKFITNIRVIGADRNRDIIQRLQQAYQDLETLVRIVRSYTVIDDIKKPQEQKTA